MQDWIGVAGAKTASIGSGSPRENGQVESFDAPLRDEPLNGEVFHSLREAEIGIASWRRHHGTVRPHASPGCRPPAPEILFPALAGCAHSTRCAATTAARALSRAP